ncbi:glycosyltransferase [Aestuariirhabdus litorea]|uniref:Glycosyltransferase n=1 Tax=Aestuariirhabdus litorea TaxID=2528527 RepID=A0A3P3VSZ4_9GAMM|nr:glycosyltransferase family 2 protein [Aestuariirhabdus litorea]RRJ84599.1 glycosyltransferase [Aestuariirhabdus litorea]RWW97825.1 glycosyltransferase [Endozoicomonadaceae bacterium GTF-13]
MRLEIVICTHNRSWLLERTLRSVARANAPSGSHLQVTVVANHCTDDTEAMIASLKPEYPFPLRLLREPRAGKSYALNHALTQLKGDFQIYIDDDHRVDTRFLCAIEELIQKHPSYKIFCGRIIPDWDGEEPQWIHSEKYPVYPLPIPHYDLGQGPCEIALDDRLPGGGNLVMAKEVTQQVGQFNENLGPSGHNLGGGEDGDYVRRALSKGYKILYHPAPIQYHWADTERLTLGYLLRKAYSRSRSAAYIQIQQPRLPPRFLFTKLALNLCQLLLPLPLARLRFYLMRSASTAGEITAYTGRYRDAKSERKHG